MKAILEQNDIEQIQAILENMPIKSLNEVQKIIQIINSKIEQPSAEVQE